MINILVTGGAGFIGSNFIRYMLKKHEDIFIVNLDLLTYAGKSQNTEGFDEYGRYEFVKGDIADRQLVKGLFERYEFRYVVNFAAETHVDRSIVSSDAFVKTNILGTQILLDASLQAWECGKDIEGYPVFVAGVKFLQISTDEVYGTLGADGYFTEETPLAPNNPYSASKASGDMLVRSYGVTYHLPVNITRCSNNYGPSQLEEKLIPLMITKALRNEPLPVYGDGLQIRDWLHVYDHCSAIDAVLRNGKLNEVYNVGGSNEIVNIELVKLILKQLGKDEELISYVQDRLGHDRRYGIDSSKIRRELGWEPVVDFETGIRDTIDWYLEKIGG